MWSLRKHLNVFIPMRIDFRENFRLHAHEFRKFANSVFSKRLQNLTLQKSVENSFRIFTRIIFFTSVLFKDFVRGFKPLVSEYLASTKKSHILKQTCSFQLQVCSSMYDLLVDIRKEHSKEKNSQLIFRETKPP